MKIYKLISGLLLALFFLCTIASPASAPIKDNLPFPKGEKIAYSLKWAGLKIGTTVSTFLGEVVLSGQRAYLITFSTKALGLEDFERIYADPKNLYPLRVERTIYIGKRKEKILEEYDQERNRVKITKSNEKKEERLIERRAKIQNAILLFYWYRNQDFKVGDSFFVTLPTLEYEAEVIKKEEIKVPLGNYQAYLLKTKPGEIKFWIGTRDGRLLLKTEAPKFLGKLTMSLTKIEKGEE